LCDGEKSAGVGVGAAARTRRLSTRLAKSRISRAEQERPSWGTCLTRKLKVHVINLSSGRLVPLANEPQPSCVIEASIQLLWPFQTLPYEIGIDEYKLDEIRDLRTVTGLTDGQVTRKGIYSLLTLYLLSFLVLNS
jgi:hypothetical protein